MEEVRQSDHTWPNGRIRIIFRAQGEVPKSIVIIPEDLVSCWCSASCNGIDIGVVASIGLDSTLSASFEATVGQKSREE